MTQRIKYLYAFSVNKADPKKKVGKTYPVSMKREAESWVNRSGYHGYVETVPYLKRSSELKIRELWILKNVNVNNFFHRHYFTISIIIDNYKGNQPYHDLNHLIGVGYLIEQLIEHNYTLDNPALRENERELILAGLLHDFNHLGSSNDSQNIAEALKGIGFFLRKMRGGTYPTFNFDLVAMAIGFTEYDFDNPNPEPPTNPFHKRVFEIIRDADQLYASYFFNKEIYDGLKKEICPRINLDPALFKARNIEYVKNLKLHTAHANTLYNEVKKDVIYKHNLMEI